MSNYKYTVSVNPPTEPVMKHLAKSIVEGLKVDGVHWEKNTGKLTFQYDDTAAEESGSGDPLMVRRIKAAEAELRAAMEAAVAVGLNVQWVEIGVNGNRKILPEPTVIITRTY